MDLLSTPSTQEKSMTEGTKEIRLRWTEEQVEAVSVAAKAIGLSISAYTKLALLERLNRDRVITQQPRDFV